METPPFVALNFNGKRERKRWKLEREGGRKEK